MADKHNDKVTYLQMIQGVIDRMSTTSAIFKGFAAMIIAGISAVSFTEINKWVLLLAITPVIFFFMMDIYYFRLEKKYRILFEKVRNEEKEPDFSMNSECKPTELINGKATWCNCIISPCISWFYVPAFLIAVVVVVLKFSGVL